MAKRKSILIALSIVLSYLALIAIDLTLLANEILTPQQAGLMAVMLFGMYVGFGILIAVFRLINKLD